MNGNAIFFYISATNNLNFFIIIDVECHMLFPYTIKGIPFISYQGASKIHFYYILLSVLCSLKRKKRVLTCSSDAGCFLNT